MAEKGRSFSIVRLNASETGWGVIDDCGGALVHIDGLALRLTKERAKEIAATMNAEARERGSAAISEAAAVANKPHPDPA